MSLFCITALTSFRYLGLETQELLVLQTLFLTLLVCRRMALAALIGAGGLGQPIIRGISLNDNATILQGAVPAALLALAVEFGFNLIDRLLIPKGLRLPPSKD